MRFIYSGLLFAVSLSLIRAQTPAATSSAPAATHSISVGAAGLVFTPNTTTAAVGDFIEFLFYPQNHSVARAEYGHSCIPYEDTGAGKVGFWSGFRPIAIVSSSPPTFQVRVNDSAPIFFYCAAPDACIKDGMVGVINPTVNETLDTQLADALNSTYQFAPGEYFPSETAASTAKPTSTSSSSTSTAASATTTPTTSATPTPTPAPASKPALSTGAIVGIAIGGSAVLVLAAALLYLCGRQQTMSEIIHQRNPSQPPPSYVTGHGPHMSMASSTAYPPKLNNLEVDPLGFSRYSASQIGTYDRSGAETESYRSRSPPLDEERRHMMPFDNALGVGGMPSPRANSPLIGRPVPESPGRNPLSPISPMRDSTYPGNEADVPSALRLNRVQEQQGQQIHELDVHSGRPTYIPYSPEANKNQPR